jgi:hypothetical protein
VAVGLLAVPVAVVVASLRPAVAGTFLTVTAAVALISAITAGWRRLSRRARLLTAAAAVALTVALPVAVLLLNGNYAGPWPAAPPPPALVTVPYAATARLGPTGWEVQEEIRIDDDATAELAAATGLSTEEAADFRSSLPLDREWRLDRRVDGTPVYLRTIAVPVQAEPVGLSRVSLDVPELSVRGVLLVPRSESSAVLLAPRAAVAATTPPPDAEVVTADDGGTVRTTVPVDDATDEVTVALLGTWLRSPVGEKLYDLSTWAPLPYVAGAVALALALWLRRRVAAGLPTMVTRLRGETAGGDSRPRPARVTARRVPGAPRRRLSVAGAGRRRDLGSRPGRTRVSARPRRPGRGP